MNSYSGTRRAWSGVNRTNIALMVVLLFRISSGAAAQTKDPNETEDPKDTELTCAQILRMGLNKFVDYYDKKFGANARSEYAIYIKCRTEDNDTQIKRLSATKRRRVNALRQALAAWETDALQMGYYLEGKGSIFATFGRAI